MAKIVDLTKQNAIISCGFVVFLLQGY